MAQALDLIYAIAGGVITAGTGWFLDQKREKRKEKYRQKILITGIIDDLSHASQWYQKFDSDYEKAGNVWFATIDEFIESRQVYLNNKEWITIIEDQPLRKKIFEYYLQSGQIVRLLQSFQTRKYDIENELKRRTAEYRASDLKLSYDDAKSKALIHMSEQSIEYDYIWKFIPDNINKLKYFKHEAEKLRQELLDYQKKHKL